MFEKLLMKYQRGSRIQDTQNIIEKIIVNKELYQLLRSAKKLWEGEILRGELYFRYQTMAYFVILLIKGIYTI